MADLDEDQNKQLTDWIAQNGVNLSTGPAPTKIQTSQPSVPSSPDLALTDRGSAEEDDSTKENDDRILDSNPGHKPEDLLATETADKMAQASKFGPDQEKMVMDSIAKNEGSIGTRLSRGAAGLGDAIMGVAGKSGPGFLNSFENREENQNKRAMEALPILQGMNEKQMAQRQALEGQSNSTPLGKAKADFLAPLLMKFFPGKTPADYQRMLQNPDSVASMIGIPADVYKSEVEAKLKASELAIQGKNATTAQQQAVTAEKRAENEVENEKQQRQQEKEQRRLGAAQDTIKDNSWLPEALGGTSHQDLVNARNVVSGIAQGGGSFDHASIPSGSTYKAPDGTTRRKR